MWHQIIGIPMQTPDQIKIPPKGGSKLDEIPLGNFRRVESQTLSSILEHKRIHGCDLQPLHHQQIRGSHLLQGQRCIPIFVPRIRKPQRFCYSKEKRIGFDYGRRITDQPVEWTQTTACGSQAFGTRCTPSPSSFPPPLDASALSFFKPTTSTSTAFSRSRVLFLPVPKLMWDIISFADFSDRQCFWKKFRLVSWFAFCYMQSS